MARNKTIVLDAEVKEVKKDKVSAQVNDTKPYFFPRLVAYFIDIMIISVISTCLMMLVPANKNYDNYVSEYSGIQTSYINGDISAKEYLNKSIDVVYDIDYCNVISMIIEVVIIILYFIVFQFYNKGQTLGKKLMKLKVVSTKDDTLTLNQLAYRSLIINAVFINVVMIGSLLFIGRSYYYYISLGLQGINTFIILISLFMILFRKDGRGLHDVVAGTKVEQV